MLLVLLRSLTHLIAFFDFPDLLGFSFIFFQVPLVVVGNKCDLESERNVNAVEGRELAKTFGCPFLETSAKTRVNVEEVCQFKGLFVVFWTSTESPSLPTHLLIISGFLRFGP